MVMEYAGYEANVEYDEEQCYYVANLIDVDYSFILIVTNSVSLEDRFNRAMENHLPFIISKDKKEHPEKFEAKNNNDHQMNSGGSCCMDHDNMNSMDNNIENTPKPCCVHNT